MKKFIILSFVFIMALSMSAFASNTRVMTMGDNNNVLLDDANIWLYPSRITEYQNIAIAELGYYSDEFDVFGVHWKMGDEKSRVLGTYFSTHSSADRIDLFYGQDMGGNKLGLHLNFMHMSNKYENDLTFGNMETATSHFDLTTSLTEASGQWDIAFNLGFGSFTNIDAAGADITEPDGINNFGLYGRYFQIKNPNYTMIYHAGIMTEKYGYKNDAGTSFVDKWMDFDLGVGFNFTPSSHVLGVFDFGVMYSKYTYEVTGATDDPTTKTFTLPYFKMGIDGDVFKWLDVRFGSTSYWTNSKSELGDIAHTQKFASNNTYFGLGFNWGHLHIDTEANPEFFLAGPDFLSGADEDLSWSLSVTYEM